MPKNREIKHAKNNEKLRTSKQKVLEKSVIETNKIESTTVAATDMKSDWKVGIFRHSVRGFEMNR